MVLQSLKSYFKKISYRSFDLLVGIPLFYIIMIIIAIIIIIVVIILA